jgi:hypothetical protein
MSIQTEEILALETLKNLGQSNRWWTRCLKCGKCSPYYLERLDCPKDQLSPLICQCGAELGGVIICARMK